MFSIFCEWEICVPAPLIFCENGRSSFKPYFFFARVIQITFLFFGPIHLWKKMSPMWKKKPNSNRSVPIMVLTVGLATLLSCHSALNKGFTSQALPVSRADSIVMVSQQTLLKTVSQKLTEKGAPHAVAFCNLNAIPLLDSLSKVYGVRISRVSEKYRNPGNKPDMRDLSALKVLSNKNVKYFQSKPAATYYAPIRIGMPSCLKCHGMPTDMDALTLNKIKELYPGDQAVNYTMGAFRGAWKIKLIK